MDHSDCHLRWSNGRSDGFATCKGAENLIARDARWAEDGGGWLELVHDGVRWHVAFHNCPKEVLPVLPVIRSLPTMVTATHWGVSYETSSAYEGATLNVHRCAEAERNQWGGFGVIYRHPQYNGMRFADVDAAKLFAWSVGLTDLYRLRYDG
jgi:hypothetical protein